jgi:hypothetical protein
MDFRYTAPVTERSAALFRSSARNGHADAIKCDPRRVEARKRSVRVGVRFADAECAVQTAEGTVHAKAGDAILTGKAGEHWRVSRAHFARKYEPLDPTRAGEAGFYRALPYRVLALRMNEPFEIELSDGVSRLNGRAGDWLIDYGDGSLGVVAASIFADTYEIPD